MKNESARFQKIFFPTAAICLFVLSGISVFAQRPSYPIDRRVEQINRQGRELEHDAMNRDLKGDARKNAEEFKRRQAVKAQIKEDLEGLQSEYNKIVLKIQSESGEPERGFVNETTTSVKKHAARLKTNLALPEPEKDEEAKSEESFANARKALVALCKHIYSFVTNPIFETPTGLNVEEATKARRELELIIRLSEKIGENSETAKKQN